MSNVSNLQKYYNLFINLNVCLDYLFLVKI